MELEILKVVREDTERIVIRVLEDCNLWPYILMVSLDSNYPNASRRAYIFENYNVRKGDYIVIYTGVGETRHFNNRISTTTHEYFWGNNDSIRLWRRDATALLVKVDDFKKVQV